MPAPPVLGGAAPVRSGCCGAARQDGPGSSPVDCRSYTKPAQALDDSSVVPTPAVTPHSAATSPECT